MKNANIKESRPILGFFKAWFVWGLVMMLLNATIWPELSTSYSSKWVYEVAVLWFSIINAICEAILPPLQSAAVWVAQIVSTSINWLISKGPTIANSLSLVFKFHINFLLFVLTLFAFMCFVSAIYMAILYFKDKKAFKAELKEILTEAKDAWDDFKNNFKNIFKKESEMPEPHSMAGQGATQDPTAASGEVKSEQ